MKICPAIFVVWLLLLPSGCSPTIRKPQLFHPGPIGYQRNNAEQFDPFPPNDVAPPIVGGRPKDFQKPPNEVIRSRQQLPLGPWRASPTPVPVLAPAPRY